jgi:hypothetical protein
MRVKLYRIVYYNMLKDKKETINLLGHDFWCAINEASQYLDETICEDGWALISVRPLKIKIGNAILNEDENEDGQVSAEDFNRTTCPHCSTLNVFPKGMTTGKCQRCKQEFVIADNPEKKEESK